MGKIPPPQKKSLTGGILLTVRRLWGFCLEDQSSSEMFDLEMGNSSLQQPQRLCGLDQMLQREVPEQPTDSSLCALKYPKDAEIF